MIRVVSPQLFGLNQAARKKRMYYGAIMTFFYHETGNNIVVMICKLSSCSKHVASRRSSGGCGVVYYGQSSLKRQRLNGLFFRKGRGEKREGVSVYSEYLILTILQQIKMIITQLSFVNTLATPIICLFMSVSIQPSNKVLWCACHHHTTVIYLSRSAC